MVATAGLFFNCCTVLNDPTGGLAADVAECRFRKENIPNTGTHSREGQTSYFGCLRKFKTALNAWRKEDTFKLSATLASQDSWLVFWEIG
jgi:hypothetical protein